MSPPRTSTSDVDVVLASTRGDWTSREEAAARFIKVWDFASARAAELYATTTAIKGRGNGKVLGVSTLPRHLRRRATSHAPYLSRRRPNLKRRRGDGGGGDGGGFRLCREALRRRGRLNAQTERVVDGVTYKVLRTHTWHAKRFAMRKHSKWGWILPSIRPGRGRGWRFIVKSIAQSALVHDSSYYSCLVIKGDGAVVRRALTELAVEKKYLNNKMFRAAQRACAIHVETFKNKRTIAPVMTYYVPRTKDSNDSEAHVWVHPAASETALHALRAAVSRQMARKVKLAGSQVIVETCDRFARLEIIGQKSFEIVQTLAPRLDFLSEKHVTHGIRRFVSHDPRAATLNIDQAPEYVDDEPSENAPTQAEFNVSCRASRDAMLERPWEPTKAIGLKNYSGVLINRGENTSEGYTMIVPKSWAVPLLLGMTHAGARAAGLKEWSWCAQRLGKPVFPDDYLDTPAGVAQRQELFDDIKALMAKTPIGKVPQGLRELEACGRSVTVRRVVRTRDALSKAKSLPKGAMVRVTLRCPWSGQPSLGSELYAPTTAQNTAWSGKKSGSRRRDDTALAEISGESIGYVTSVSAPAAAVGLASALIRVKSLELLNEKFSRGAGRVFLMCKPPGKPVVPAEAHVVVSPKAALFDEPWW